MFRAVKPYQGTWSGSLRLGLGIVGIVLLPVSFAKASHDAPSERQTAWSLVKERCYICHYLDRPDVKFAPSLKGLFQREGGRLMNGKPVDERTVTEWITEGSPKMPAFKHTLTPEQVQLIVKFLKEGWAAQIPMLRNSR